MNQTITIAINSIAAPGSNLRSWLEEQSQDMPYLLAHLYEGVVWGRRGTGGWQFSTGIAPNSPPLSLERLLELRLFGSSAEVYLWRDGGRLHGRQITENAGSNPRVIYDEPYILWGTHRVSSQNGFTVLRDGDQEMLHAVPLVIDPDSFVLRNKQGAEIGRRRAACLTVRHYIERHKTGLARITLSRLQNVGLCP